MTIKTILNLLIIGIAISFSSCEKSITEKISLKKINQLSKKDKIWPVVIREANSIQKRYQDKPEKLAQYVNISYTEYHDFLEQVSNPEFRNKITNYCKKSYPDTLKSYATTRKNEVEKEYMKAFEKYLKAKEECQEEYTKFKTKYDGFLFENMTSSRLLKYSIRFFGHNYRTAEEYLKESRKEAVANYNNGYNVYIKNRKKLAKSTASAKAKLKFKKRLEEKFKYRKKNNPTDKDLLLMLKHDYFKKFKSDKQYLAGNKAKVLTHAKSKLQEQKRLKVDLENKIKPLQADYKYSHYGEPTKENLSNFIKTEMNTESRFFQYKLNVFWTELNQIDEECALLYSYFHYSELDMPSRINYNRTMIN